MPGLFDTIAARLGYIKTQAVSDPAVWLQETAAHHRWDNLFEFDTDEQNLAMYSKLSWVQSAVGAVAQMAAVTPLGVFELAGEKRNAIPNHPFETLLDVPNPLMSRYELLEATFAFRALTGNAYWWLNRANDKAAPDEIWVMPSQYVRPVPDEQMYLKGYIYDAGEGKQLPLDLHEVVHFRRYNPLNPFVGLSPLDSLRMATRGDLAQQSWNLNYFDKDNAKMPGALAFSAPIPDAEWERMKSDIRRQHGGTKRNLMMLRGVGDKGVSWVSMAMSQRDMQFLEGRTFTKEEIYSVYAPGLASMLAINATEANSTAGRKTFTEMGIWPHLVAVAQKITNDVLPAYGTSLRAEFEDIRVADRAMELQEQQAFASVHTVDEVRQKYYDAEPIGDERGKLLVSEIGKGLTPTEEQQQPDMGAILEQIERGDDAEDAEPEAQTPAEDERTQPDGVADAPEDAPDAEGREAGKRRERRTFRKWLKRRDNPDIDEFVSEYLTHAEKADILAEVVGEDNEAAKATRFIPRGADEALPPIPSTLQITDADIEHAIAQWDELMPDYGGLLEAESNDNAGEL